MENMEKAGDNIRRDELGMSFLVGWHAVFVIFVHLILGRHLTVIWILGLTVNCLKNSADVTSVFRTGVRCQREIF